MGMVGGGGGGGGETTENLVQGTFISLSHGILYRSLSRGAFIYCPRGGGGGICRGVR